MTLKKQIHHSKDLIYTNKELLMYQVQRETNINHLQFEIILKFFIFILKLHFLTHKI